MKMTLNKRIISLAILITFLVASVAVGSFAWFTKYFELGGANISTGKLGLTCGSYVYDYVEGILVPVTETVNNITTEYTTGTDAAGSSISISGGVAYKEIGKNKPLTFYLIVQKNKDSIDFEYAISTFLAGLEPTYDYASGNVQDLQSGAYANAGGFWYDISKINPGATAETIADSDTGIDTEDVLADAKNTLAGYIATNGESSATGGETLFNIGKYSTTGKFDKTSDCHYYAVTIGVKEEASETATYSNQSIGISAHIMAYQEREGEGTTHYIADAKQLTNTLANYMPGDTFKFMNSVSIDGDIIFGAPVTLDLDGHTLTVTGNVRFEYNLAYDTIIRTTGGGRLIVRSAGSSEGYAGGDLSIVTPDNRVLLEGTNSSNIGAGDIYVQGVFSVMAAYDKGIIFDGCNVYAMTSDGNIPKNENLYKTINVYDSTWVQINSNTTVGDIRVANKDVKMFRLLNNGTINYVYTDNMFRVYLAEGEYLSSPQIDIYNNGIIIGNSAEKHITLPEWSLKWKWDPEATTADGEEGAYVGNTRIVQGLKSNKLSVSCVSELFKDSDIENATPTAYVETENGDYQKLIVNYVDITENEIDEDTLKSILDAFLEANLNKYSDMGNACTDASDCYDYITHLTVRTGYGKYLTNTEDGDYAYIRGFKNLVSLNLTDAATCFGSVDIPVLPLENGKEYFTGEYYYIPKGALAGLTKLENIQLPSNAQVIYANLIGNTLLEKTYPTITLPTSILAIEMNEDKSHALSQFYVIDMPTSQQVVMHAL